MPVKETESQRASDESGSEPVKRLRIFYYQPPHGPIPPGDYEVLDPPNGKKGDVVELKYIGPSNSDKKD